MRISELTKRNKVLEATVGQSETDRMKLSEDSDQQTSELKVALADAITENRVKSDELKSLFTTVESLTHTLDASKVVQIIFCSLYSSVSVAVLPEAVFGIELNTIMMNCMTSQKLKGCRCGL